MFFYIVLAPSLPVYEVLAIRVNTTKSTYTFTSVPFRHARMLKFHMLSPREKMGETYCFCLSKFSLIHELCPFD